MYRRSRRVRIRENIRMRTRRAATYCRCCGVISRTGGLTYALHSPQFRHSSGDKEEATVALYQSAMMVDPPLAAPPWQHLELPAGNRGTEGHQRGHQSERGLLTGSDRTERRRRAVDRPRVFPDVDHVSHHQILCRSGLLRRGRESAASTPAPKPTVGLRVHTRRRVRAVRRSAGEEPFEVPSADGASSFRSALPSGKARRVPGPSRQEKRRENERLSPRKAAGVGSKVLTFLCSALARSRRGAKFS